MKKILVLVLALVLGTCAALLRDRRTNTVRTAQAVEDAVGAPLLKALSFAGLVLLCPVFAVIAAAVWIDDPGPVFFKQKRIRPTGRILW